MNNENELALQLLARPELTWSHYAEQVWSRQTYDFEVAGLKQRAASAATMRAEQMPRSPMPDKPPQARSNILLAVDVELPRGEHLRLTGFLVQTASGLMAVSAGDLPADPVKVTVSPQWKVEPIAIDGRAVHRDELTLAIAVDRSAKIAVEALEPRAEAIQAGDPLYVVSCTMSPQGECQRIISSARAGKPVEGDEITVVAGIILPEAIGAPILDASGHAVAVVTRVDGGTLGGRAVRSVVAEAGIKR